MRRFLTASFIALSLAVGITGVVPITSVQTLAPVAHAQTPGIGSQPNNNQTLQTTTDGFGWVMTQIMTLFAWLVGVAALALDYAAYYTVVVMGNYVNHLTAIGTAWRIMRDVGNIFFIFGFLAAGIATILQVDFYGWGSKMLPKLLIAAVLLNFSLFFSEAVIDMGNLVATQFFTQINGGVLPSTTQSGALAVNGTTLTTANEGISNAIMGQIGLQTMYNDARTNPAALEGGHTLIIGFMGIILFIITAFVLFSLALVLVMRFVYLIFVIILSPIGFVGYAIPKLSHRSQQWLDALLKQTFIAPALFLLLYVALAVITDVNFLRGFTATGDWLGYINQNNLVGFGGILLSFFVAMGLLLYVVYKAKDWGAVGASWATSTSGKIFFGGTAWALNRTAGRGFYYAARRLNQSAKFNKIDAMTGRVMSRGLKRGATATYDMRGIQKFGGLNKIVDVGKPPKEGFVGARERADKEHEEWTKRLEKAHKEASKPTERQEELTSAHLQAQKERFKAQDERDTAQQVLDALKKSGNASQENLTKATERLADATKQFNAAATVESDAKKSRDYEDKKEAERLSSRINESKRAYAEGLDTKLGKVIGFFAYGPGTGDSARKIKQSLKGKSNAEQLKDIVTKIEKENAEAEGKSGGSETGGKEGGAGQTERPEETKT